MVGFPYLFASTQVECHYTALSFPEAEFEADIQYAEIRSYNRGRAHPVRIFIGPCLHARARIERIHSAIVCTKIQDSLMQGRGRKDAFAWRMRTDAEFPRE